MTPVGEERKEAAAVPCPTAHRPPASEAPPWLLRGRVPCLDGLRGISILLVLLCHGATTHGFPSGPWAARCFQTGALGVDIFFATSGFLITLLLLRELERTQSVSLKQFYLRRALRILPAYLAFLIVLFTLSHLGIARLDRRAWVGVLTYTVNFKRHWMWTRWEAAHLWSLSAEEQFYLLWPPLLLLLRPKRARFALLGYFAAAPVLRWLLWVHCPGKVPTAGMLERVDGIASGCLLALLAIQPAFRTRTTLGGWKAGCVGALALGSLAIGAVIGPWPHSLWGYVLRYPLVGMGIAALLWLCANHAESVVGRILRSRPLVTLGTLSYSLYLWQQLFINPLDASWICRWPLNLCFALLAADASYRYIEAPFLRIKERFSPTALEQASSPQSGCQARTRYPEHGATLSSSVLAPASQARESV